MVRVDADGDATTTTSSGATLTLPANATVLFAGLYYGADHGGISPTPSDDALRTVKFRPPGSAGYLTLGPTSSLAGATEIVLEKGGAAASDFGVFMNVTPLVQAAGSGRYFVADVRSSTGVDREGGWALVVAYEDTTQRARNLSIFDGFKAVRQNGDVSIPITGFRTPPAGDRRTAVGVAAYEGDRGTTGDEASLNNETLFNAVRPSNNFFNSSISHFGDHFEDKNPNFVNQLGFDAAS